ncbi:hypothetical protein [Cyanothece sp. BG0011]|uniref:hypothetical protein n=1 Tax=Cyanothece sp. BG0011 TaxID=2082950 RepID=UPI000D1E8DA9|nr:hypothetical protein [Cyanothece sp. BG0011]
MTDQAEQLRSKIEQYRDIIPKLQPRLLFPFYHYPSILITQRVTPIKNRLGLWLVFRKVMADLKKQNYDRTETGPLNVKLLSDSVGIVSTVATRYSKDGQILATFGASYTLRKVEDDYRIVVLCIHDVDAVS